MNVERQEIGGYRLIERIGVGGMSTVYEAVDGGGERVALKLLHPALAADPRARERLRREVAMMQRVHGRFVAQILDAETEEPDVFIVTELIDGPTLEQDVAEQGVFTGADLAQLAQELGEALESIHAEGVLHRDLKPSNVMLGEDGPVLIDFGIAQLGDDLRLTQTGSLTHTPGWADPRVIRGSAPDELADWWSMGAVLAFAATGRPPFGRGNTPAVMNRVLRGEADLEGLSEPLAAAFLSALSANEGSRISYATLTHMLADPGFAPAIPVEGMSADPAGHTQVVNASEVERPAEAPRFTPVESQATRQWDPEEETDPGATIEWDREAEEQWDPDSTRIAPLPRFPENGLPSSVHEVDTAVPDPTQVMALPHIQKPIPESYEPQGRMGPYPPVPAEPELAPEAMSTLPASVPYWTKPPRTFPLFFLIVGVALALLGGIYPWLTLSGVIAVLWFVDVVGDTREELMGRRYRRGGPYSGESVRSVARLPWAFVTGALRIALSALVGGGVAIGIGWPLARMDLARSRPLYTAVVAIALVMMWAFAASHKAREGARHVMENVAPTTGYRMLWVLMAIVAAVGAFAYWGSGSSVSFVPIGHTFF